MIHSFQNTNEICKVTETLIFFLYLIIPLIITNQTF